MLQMSRIYPVGLRVLVGLAIVLLPAGTTADPVPSPAPTGPESLPPQQVTLRLDLSTSQIGGPPIDMKKWKEKDERDKNAPPFYWYTLVLKNVTPQLVLSELDAAFVPASRTDVLRPGQTLHCPFRIDGLIAIVPDPRTKSLLFLANPHGFATVRELVECLDAPTDHSTNPTGKKGQASVSPTLATPLRPGVGGNGRQSVCQSPAAAPGEPGTDSSSEETLIVHAPLEHLTPDQFLREMRSAYVPDNGAMWLMPGETASSSFPWDGVQIIFPSRPDNPFLVFATKKGFESFKDLAGLIDKPGNSAKSSSLGENGRQTHHNAVI
jgi:hypothetical protein